MHILNLRARFHMQCHAPTPHLHSSIQHRDCGWVTKR